MAADLLDMIPTRLLIAVLVIAVTGGGCSIIAGKEDTGLPGQDEKTIQLYYVETLRNQASLRGEGFRDVVYTAGTPTTLQRPNTVFADAHRVYVTDQTLPPRVFIFDRGERTASILAVPLPPADGKLVNPTAIAVDSGNVILVADAQQGRVFGYDRNGVLLLTFGKSGDLAYPTGIVIDNRRNRIYIADSHAHLVRAFTSLGDRVFDIGVDGSAEQRLKSPIGLAMDQEGRIYVLDDQNKRVHVYDPAGTLIRKFPLSRGVPGDSLRPRGIAVDSAGHIYVSDSVNNNILIFESDGRYLKTWGKTGSLSGDFWTPQGLFIDERDHIYIADQTNARIQVYQFQK
jgi:DNA-binding beta-propeller fold protein YncE